MEKLNALQGGDVHDDDARQTPRRPRSPRLIGNDATQPK
jgi:hypothetical protein